MEQRKVEKVDNLYIVKKPMEYLDEFEEHGQKIWMK